MAGILGAGLMGAMNLGSGLMATAPLYGQYALGAAQMGAGGLMQGAAGAMGSQFAGKVGTGLGMGLAGWAGKGMANVLTGNGPIQRRKRAQAAAGGCSCSNAKPQYSCEEKCAYGRMMAEKCQGCKGQKKKTYRKKSYGYSSGGYSSPYGSSNWGVSGARKPRVAGRQNRRTIKTLGRQNRRTNRQTARQNRRANRRWRN